MYGESSFENYVAFIDWLIHKAVSVYVGLGKSIITVLSHVVICFGRWFFLGLQAPLVHIFKNNIC
jgi:hypothetical protein